jgi:rubrerythrin
MNPKAIRRSLYQFFVGRVGLICQTCGKYWVERWVDVEADNGNARCPVCGQTGYVGGEDDYD